MFPVQKTTRLIRVVLMRYSHKDICWVHPRVYGEYAVTMNDNQTVTGSSPHLWGICTLLSEEALNNGLIPTPVGIFPIALINRTGNRGGLIPVHTGNIIRPENEQKITPVHPRTYGEYFTRSKRFSEISGLSPHIRGIRYVVAKLNSSRWVIPTPMGNVSKKGEKTMITEGPSPYIRGICMDVEKARYYRGSSPCIRGLSRTTGWTNCQHRVIPAHTGNISKDG